MEATFNQLPILSGVITLPLFGRWWAELEVATDDAAEAAVDKAVSLMLGESEFIGTVLRGGVFGGRASVVLLGGSARLRQVLPPKYYDQPPLKIPLLDICNETGEMIDEGADAATLAFQLAQWHRGNFSAGASISHVVAQSGASWRLLPNGKIWVGPESWPAYEGEAQIRAEHPAKQSAELFVETGDVLPGLSIDGRKIGRVCYRLAPANTKAVVWFEE